MTDVSKCLFCAIAAGEIPAEMVDHNDDVVAFRDLNPQAPLHVLVIPRAHYANVGELASAAPQVLAALVKMGTQVAAREADGQFRLVFNSGARAGQSVFHVHGHVLGGAQLGWTPA